MELQSDVLVLGSGMAGLLFALEAAKHGTVTVITKKARPESNTKRAQGGLAAVQADDDALDLHVRDTIAVGKGLSHPEAVRLAVQGGPTLVSLLQTLGVSFTQGKDGSFSLGREGGHSRRRIVHVEDATGRAIESALLRRVEADPNIQVLEEQCAVDLIRLSRVRKGGSDRVIGAYVHDSASQKIRPFVARIVMLATGGCGKVYQYTSNSDVATGDGIAMAYRVGCSVANLEFMQFHPTCLYHPEAKNFLISEAVRGEGAILTTIAGDRFLSDTPMRELAPRDIVARAIDRAMKRSGDAHVLLHLERLSETEIRARFPVIHETCLRYGIDVIRQPIPVVPAAHYMCGGVVVDVAGRTDLPGFYAAGEVACTGVHGANRLASNSLLEAGVFALRAAEDAAAQLARLPVPPQPPPWQVGKASLPKETILINAHWDLVRRLMWDFVGIVRTDHRLGLAARYLEIVRRSIETYYWDFVLDADLIELRNVALVADLIIRAALSRTESRGLHYNEDHPDEDPLQDTDTVLKLEAEMGID